MEPSHREKCKLASKTRQENAWLNGLQLPEDEYIVFRSVQNTYKVQLTSFPDVGPCFRIWLLWDYDRIWGVFDMGRTKGLFLIDPGPKPLLGDGAPPQRLAFVWRGMSKSQPDASICNELLTNGEIWIDPEEKTLEGHFNFMNDGGGVGDGRCGFRGSQHFGPSVVPYSLEDVVEEWNDYGLIYPEETVRQSLSPSDLAADLRRRDEQLAESEART